MRTSGREIEILGSHVDGRHSSPLPSGVRSFIGKSWQEKSMLLKYNSEIIASRAVRCCLGLSAQVCGPSLPDRPGALNSRRCRLFLTSSTPTASWRRLYSGTAPAFAPIVQRRTWFSAIPKIYWVYQSDSHSSAKNVPESHELATFVQQLWTYECHFEQRAGCGCKTGPVAGLPHMRSRSPSLHRWYRMYRVPQAISNGKWGPTFRT
jgi:hypothetical protein